MIEEFIWQMVDENIPLNKRELLMRMRRVISLGIEAIKAENATEKFEYVAWQSVASRSHRRASTQQDLRHFVRRMLRVEGVANRPLRSMTTRECRELLQKAFGGSLHSYRKGRAILHSIFAYGMRHEWCDSNPIDRIEIPEIREVTIKPLNCEEVERLKMTVRHSEHKVMSLSLYLMLYCGVRPAEVRRIDPQRDILWKEQQLIIRPNVSKTGGGRVIPLRLAAMVPRHLHIIPDNWEYRWKALRRAAGFQSWRADTLRHTFATYHALYFRNIDMLQWEMGHRDSSLLRSRYVLGVGGEDAVNFWREERGGDYS